MCRHMDYVGTHVSAHGPCWHTCVGTWTMLAHMYWHMDRVSTHVSTHVLAHGPCWHTCVGTWTMLAHMCRHMDHLSTHMSAHMCRHMDHLSTHMSAHMCRHMDHVATRVLAHGPCFFGLQMISRIIQTSTNVIHLSLRQITLTSVWIILDIKLSLIQ